MPISLPAPILHAKDQSPELPGIPLLLAEFQFSDGSFQYFSTHPLNATEGLSSYTYNGNAYFARMSQQDLSSIQARSEQGIDRVDSVTLHLSDSDRVLLGLEKTVGFSGAILTLRVVMWQADTGNFTSDSLIPFIGICNGPTYQHQGSGDVMQIGATSSHNMARIDVPLWQVSFTCANDFPLNAAERFQGSTDMSHHCWSCGYNPDQGVDPAGTGKPAIDPFAGGDARRGSTTTPNVVDGYGRTISDANGVYTWCGKTRADCESRGMFNTDSQRRRTLRFNGIEWTPVNREISSKSYLAGKTIRFTQLGRNDSIFAERFPMLYGTQWVHPVVTNVTGDANETRSEFVVCQDWIGNDLLPGQGGFGGCGVIQVVANGVIIPPRNSSPDPNIWFWQLIATGARTGGINGDNLYSNLGDPYGSLATGFLSFYRDLGDAGSPPNMQVKAIGPLFKIPNTADPNDQANWPMLRSTNNAWVLLDNLIWANWKYTEIDLQSFLNEAPYCDAQIVYTPSYFPPPPSGDYVNPDDLVPVVQAATSATYTHERFKAQFVLEKARKANEVITGLLRSFNGQLSKDPFSGKLKLLIRKTLADQQPSVIDGSNYATPIASAHADGSAGVGYVAFRFDESVILRDSADAAPQLNWSVTPASQTPNALVFQFQNEENDYSADSLTVKDPDAIVRAGGYLSSQEIPENFNILGISNYDQAFRVANTVLAERLRGNPGRDTRGSVTFGPFPVSGITVIHLKTGDLVLFQWQSYGFAPLVSLQSPPGVPISGVLCRVMQVDHQTNLQRAMVTLAWHEDLWYTDKYGQQGPPISNDSRKGPPGRPPYPWQPYGAQPISGDSIYGTPAGYSAGSWWLFGLAQQYTLGADGSTLAQLLISGCPPVNQFSDIQPPLVGNNALVNSSGGTIPGGITLYLAIAAVDRSGLQSPLSSVFTVTTPAGASTKSITTPTVFWKPGTVGFVLYGGVDSNNLSAQLSNPLQTPATITLTSLSLEAWGPPDVLANKLHFQAKRIIHGGVWGAACSAVSANTLTFSPTDPNGTATTFATNQWVGYDIQMVAWTQGDTRGVPVATFRVTSNDGINLHVTPDPVANQIVPGTVFVMMIRPDPSSTSTRIVEPNFRNAFAPNGLAVNEGQNTLRILSGTGAGSTSTIISNDATSYTLDGLPYTPDSTSRVVIEEPQWTDKSDTEKIQNTAPSVSQTWNFDVSNYIHQTILVRVNVLDGQGNSSLYQPAPLRMFFLWGQGFNQRTVTASTRVLPNDQIIACDTTAGAITVTLLPSAQTKGRSLFIQKITGDANPVTIQPYGSETLNGASSLTLANQWDVNEVVSNG